MYIDPTARIVAETAQRRFLDTARLDAAASDRTAPGGRTRGGLRRWRRRPTAA